MHTHILLDQSASMRSIDAGVHEGLRQLVASLPAESVVTVSRFNHAVVLGARCACGEAAGALEAQPYRGQTALFDAVLAALARELRDPIERTHLVCVTDGIDNASKATLLEVREAVREAREEREWVVTFLGCNQDATLTGASLGLDQARALTYEASNSGVCAALRAVSENAADFARTGTVRAFTELQRQTSLPPRMADEPPPLFHPPSLHRQRSYAPWTRVT